jgi:hypothetical protein
MPPVTQDILFKVDTVGTSGAVAKLGKLRVGVAAVGAALVVAAKKLYDMSEQAAEFQRMVENTTIQMAAFNRQTGGLIDTAASYQEALKLQNAEISVSEKQMAAVGAAAAQMAQKLGEGQEGATRRFQELTKAIISGRETALLKYGIELSQVENKSLAAAEALELLEEKFGDTTVKAETAGEKLDSLKNTIGTIVDFEMAKMTAGLQDIVGGIIETSDALQMWENDLVATNGALAEHFTALTDLDVVQAANNETVAEAIRLGEDTWILQGRLIMQNIHLSDSEIEKARSYVLLKDAALEAAKAIQWKQQIEAAGRERERLGEGNERIGNSIEGMMNASSEQEVMRYFNQAQAEIEKGESQGLFNQIDLMDTLGAQLQRVRANQRFAASLGGGGGGGRTAPSRTDDIAPNVFQFRDLGSLASDVPGFVDASGRAPRGGGAGAAAQQAHLDALQAQRDRELAIEENFYSKMIGLRAEDLEHQQMTADQKVGMTEMLAKGTTDILRSMAAFQDTETRKGFEREKKYMMGLTFIETQFAALAAFRSAVQALPFPANFIVGGSLATAVQAQGIASMVAINRRKFDDKSVSGGATPGGSARFDTGGQGGGEAGGNSYTFNVLVEGQTVFNSVLRENELQAQSGNEAFITGS